jgi:hypothetical protein
MCRIWRMKFLPLIFLLGVSAAQAQDVGVVDRVSGEVTFSVAGARPGKVKPYMKVRAGDRFQIAAGAQVRVLYFEGARQERWAGPASFRAAKQGGKALSGSPAVVAALPAGVPQRIARVPELVRHAQLGGVQVRSGRAPGDKADGATGLHEARVIYDSLRARLAKDDITPELYLYAVLSEHGLRDEMNRVAQEMRRRQPDNEEVKWLAKELR